MRASTSETGFASRRQIGRAAMSARRQVGSRLSLWQMAPIEQCERHQDHWGPSPLHAPAARSCSTFLTAGAPPATVNAPGTAALTSSASATDCAPPSRVAVTGVTSHAGATATPSTASPGEAERASSRNLILLRGERCRSIRGEQASRSDSFAQGAIDAAFVASGLTATGVPSVGPGVTLTSAGPSVARTQGAAFGGAKCKPEDAATRSVSAAARGARGLAEGTQAHNVLPSAGSGVARRADLSAPVAVSASHDLAANGTPAFTPSLALTPGAPA